MEILTREQVLHIAHLARLNLNDDEIEKYRYQLKQILDEINKIDMLNLDEDKIMVSPSSNSNRFLNSRESNVDSVDFVSNAPKFIGNYIEVRWEENE